MARAAEVDRLAGLLHGLRQGPDSLKRERNTLVSGAAHNSPSSAIKDLDITFLKARNMFTTSIA